MGEVWGVQYYVWIWIEVYVTIRGNTENTESGAKDKYIKISLEKMGRYP